MIKQNSYVVAKDGKFYKNDKEFVDDLQKAKVFHSKGTANKVSKKTRGEVKELV